MYDLKCMTWVHGDRKVVILGYSTLDAFSWKLHTIVCGPHSPAESITPKTRVLVPVLILKTRSDMHLSQIFAWSSIQPHYEIIMSATLHHSCCHMRNIPNSTWIRFPSWASIQQENGGAAACTQIYAQESEFSESVIHIQASFDIYLHVPIMQLHLEKGKKTTVSCLATDLLHSWHVPEINRPIITKLINYTLLPSFSIDNSETNIDRSMPFEMHKSPRGRPHWRRTLQWQLEWWSYYSWRSS